MDRALDRSTRLKRRARGVAIGGAVAAGLALPIVLLPGWLRPSLDRDAIRVASATRGVVEATLLASGTVVPASERVVSSPLEARVEAKLREPGDVLEAGDAILELDTSEAELELERLDERLAESAADRVEASLALERAITDLEQRIATGALDLELAEYRLEQHRELFADGLISEETLRQREVELRRADIALRHLREQVGHERRSHENRLERLDLDVALLRKERDDAARRLEASAARSPKRGVLTWVVDEVGATVSRGATVARIADLDRFRVEGSVSDAYASRIRPGQAARVRIDDGATIPGIVTAIHPTIEQGTVRFTVELDAPDDGRLRNQLRADVLVVTERVEDALSVPRGPFFRGVGERQDVHVVRDDVAVRVPVKFGLVAHDRCQIVEGLRDGDTIIVSGAEELRHADRIRIR